MRGEVDAGAFTPGMGHGERAEEGKPIRWLIADEGLAKGASPVTGVSGTRKSSPAVEGLADCGVLAWMPISTDTLRSSELGGGRGESPISESGGGEDALKAEGLPRVSSRPSVYSSPAVKHLSSQPCK